MLNFLNRISTYISRFVIKFYKFIENCNKKFYGNAIISPSGSTIRIRDIDSLKCNYNIVINKDKK